MKSNGNGFEEMVAIQLAVRSWPGQAKLSRGPGAERRRSPGNLLPGEQKIISPGMAATLLPAFQPGPELPER